MVALIDAGLSPAHNIKSWPGIGGGRAALCDRPAAPEHSLDKYKSRRSDSALAVDVINRPLVHDTRRASYRRRRGRRRRIMMGSDPAVPDRRPAGRR